MKLLRLPKSKVQIGVPLPWNVRLEDESLFLKRGQIVQDQHQLDLLIERGAFVDPEEVKAYSSGSLYEAEPPKELPKPARQINLFELWEKAARKLEELLKHFPEVPDFLPQVDALANEIIDLVKQDADVGIFQAIRQEKDAYSTCAYTHAVYSALMSILIGLQMRFTAVQILALVKAALTMNAPIMALQGRMAAQEGPIVDKQRAEIKAHPDKAVEWLKQQGVTDVDWLTAVAQHHERADGSGYPNGLTEVSPLAHALRVADIFMAKISRRLTREPLSPQDAVRHLLHEDGNGPMSVALVKEIGIYPPGDFVKLKSGELAVVVKHGSNPKMPVVACITDAAGKPIVKTVRRDTSAPEFAVTGVVADKTLALRVPPERLYGFAVIGAA